MTPSEGDGTLLSAASTVNENLASSAAAPTAPAKMLLELPPLPSCAAARPAPAAEEIILLPPAPQVTLTIRCTLSDLYHIQVDTPYQVPNEPARPGFIMIPVVPRLPLEIWIDGKLHGKMFEPEGDAQS